MPAVWILYMAMPVAQKVSKFWPYLSIYSAYLAIIFDDLAVVPLLERGYSLWFRTSYIWD